MKKIKLLLLSFFAIAELLSAQSVVDINLNVKHTVGDISEFDRKKFINVHAALADADFKGETDMMAYLLDSLDVYVGRDNGTMGWNIKDSYEDANNPGYVLPDYMETTGATFKTDYAGRNYSWARKYDSRGDLVIGGQQHSFWPGTETEPYTHSDSWTIASGDAVGDYMGQFFNEFYRNDDEDSTMGHPRPKYMEVLNEPLYELIDGDATSSIKPIDVFRFHNEVSKAFKRHNTDVMVGGYAVAFPWFEVENFTRWEERMKLFYDTCGAYMDYVSVHLYDFNKHHFDNETTFDGPVHFKGGRMEATFDMMEYYSNQKFGYVKPVMVNEFGNRDHSLEWKEWTAERDWIYMTSISTMLMQFMDRPDVMLKTIPFIVLKAEWGRQDNGNPYGPRLMRQAFEDGTTENADNEDWVFTELIKFYELWADVNGTRVDVRSGDPDLLADAYVEGNKAYVIISNIKQEIKDVNLNLFDLSDNTLESITARHLYKPSRGNALIAETELSVAQNSTFELGEEATAILTYTFTNDVLIDEETVDKKYFADSYINLIRKNTMQTYAINGVELGNSNTAELRIAISRPHDTEKFPTVLFNGTAVDYDKAYSGDDQNLRDQFYGMIEVNIPENLLQENNNVSITFPDNMGYVSTVTMRVFNSTRSVYDPMGIGENSTSGQLRFYPNPTSGVLNIEKPSSLPAFDIEIYNLEGAVVASYSQFAGESIDIRTLGSGLYFVKTVLGDEIETHKVILF